MDTYLMMLYVTLDQETSLKAFFLANGWSYCKPDLRVGTDTLGPLDARPPPATSTYTAGPNETASPAKRPRITPIRFALAKHPETTGKQQLKRKSTTQTSNLPETGTSEQTTEIETSGLAHPLTEQDFDMDGFIETADIKIEQTYDSDNNADDADDADDAEDDNDEDETDDDDDVSKDNEPIAGSSDQNMSAGTSSAAGEKTPRTSGRKRKPSQKVADNDEEEGATADVSAVNEIEAMPTPSRPVGAAVTDKPITKKKRHIGTTSPSGQAEPKYPIDDSGKAKCAICRLRMLPRNLQRHMKLHMGLPHRCPGCSMYFETREQRDKHRAAKHQSKFLCNECGARYQSTGALAEHMSRDHGGGTKKVFQCQYENCGNVYVRQSYLDDHVNKHLGLKPYICEKCAKAFTYKYALNRHVLYCEGVFKKYSCDYCSETYNERHELATHVCLVHPEIEFSCDCGKTYRLRCELESHLQNCQFVKNPTGKENISNQDLEAPENSVL